MVLAIDSALTRTGWALVERQGPRDVLHAVGALNVVGHRRVQDLVARVAAHGGVGLVAIEDAYFGKNVAVIKKLSRLVGCWQQEFWRAGIPTRLVMANAWQLGLLSGLITNKSSRDERKLAARQYVMSVFKRELGFDECDAACMGTWVSRQEWFAGQAVAAASGHAEDVEHGPDLIR
jgi:hypothetical protein